MGCDREFIGKTKNMRNFQDHGEVLPNIAPSLSVGTFRKNKILRNLQSYHQAKSVLAVCSGNLFPANPIAVLTLFVQINFRTIDKVSSDKFYVILGSFKPKHFAGEQRFAFSKKTRSK